jgi:hypothetical protein
MLRLEITLPPNLSLDLDPRLVPGRSALRRCRDRLGSAAQDATGHGQRARLLWPRQGPSSCLVAGAAAGKLEMA